MVVACGADELVYEDLELDVGARTWGGGDIEHCDAGAEGFWGVVEQVVDASGEFEEVEESL